MMGKSKLIVNIPYSERFESEDLYKRYTDITVSAIKVRELTRRRPLRMLGLGPHVDFKLLDKEPQQKSESRGTDMAPIDEVNAVLTENQLETRQLSSLISRAAVAIGTALFGRQ